MDKTDGTFFTIRTDSRSFGVNTINKLNGEIIQRSNGCYVVKVPYSRDNPSRYVVWEVLDETKSGLLIHGHARILVDFPVRVPIEQTKFINWETQNNKGD